MHIVFFTHRFSPDIGGVELSVARLSEALGAIGHRVTVVTESDSEAERIPGVTVLRLRVATRRPFTRLLYWRWMWGHRALLRDADVLHFHDYGTFVHWFFPLRLLVRTPVYAMTFHGFDSWPVRRKDDLLRAMAARCMDVTFGCGTFIASHYRQRIDHWHIGAPVRRPVAASTQLTSSFLYIGRLAEDTGILSFTRCLAKAATETSGRPLLTVVGDGPLRAEVAAAAGDRCDLVFHPATADVDGFLASAGVVVATGFLAVLDAFAFERPVIAPALTAIKRDYFSSIPDAGELLFLAADEEELQQILGTLLRSTDSDGVRTRIARAKAFVDALSWTGIANSHLDAYERAAA